MSQTLPYAAPCERKRVVRSWWCRRRRNVAALLTSSAAVATLAACALIGSCQQGGFAAVTASRIGQRCGWRGQLTRRSASAADRLGKSLPFLEDAELVSEDVIYEGPLFSLQGRDEYVAFMGSLRRDLFARLEGLELKDLETWELQPGEVTARWSARFIAPLPPTARFRGLPAGMAVLPGEKVA
ncbi:unnamed protein product, partial [Polarella glacialis]